MVKMKSMFAIGWSSPVSHFPLNSPRVFSGFAFTALLSMFNSIFDGRVVAKLPFTPIYWVQGKEQEQEEQITNTEC